MISRTTGKNERRRHRARPAAVPWSGLQPLEPRWLLDANLTMPMVDNTAALTGFVTQDMIFDTDTRFLSAMIQIDLDQGSIYQDPIGTMTQPNQSVIDLFPTVEFDTYADAGDQVPSIIGGAVFSEEQINITWFTTSPQVVGTVQLARFTLSNDAAGTWSGETNRAGPIIFLKLEVSGHVVNGQLTLSPTVANEVHDQTAGVNVLFDYPVPGNTFEDEDSGPATLSAQSSNGSNLPDWLSFDGTTFQGTPTSSDDDVEVEVIATDSDNNSVSDLFTIFITSVEVPDPPQLDLLDTSDTGSNTSDEITMETTLSIQATIEPGTLVRLFVDGIEDAAVSAPNGTAYFTLVELDEGEHVLTATAESGASISEVSTLPVTIDITPPSVDIVDVDPDPRNTNIDEATIIFSESVVGVALDHLSLTGDAGTDLLGAAQTITTDDNTTFVLGNLANLTTDADTYTLSVTPDGITDVAGNSLAAGDIEQFTVVDANIPTLDLLDTSDSGRDSTDNLTNVATPTVRISADENSLVRVFVDGTETHSQTIGTVPIEVVLDSLSDGPNTVTASADSGTGPIFSAPLVITSDRVAPPPPTTLSLTNDTDLGQSNTDDVTSNITPAVEGTAENDALVTVTTDGLSLGQTLSNGTWAIDIGPLAHGTTQVTATAEDRAGNISDLSAPLNVEIDSEAPAASIVAIDPDPRRNPVNTVTFVFDEPVNDFGIDGLSLSLDGGPNLLGVSQTLISSDQRNFTLDGLDELTQTNGQYRLTLHAGASNLEDVAGNGVDQDVVEVFDVDTSLPPFSDDFEGGLDPSYYTEGNVVVVNAPTGNSVAQLSEASDAAISRMVELPVDATTISLDYRFTQMGIDDEIIVSVIDGGANTELFRARGANFVGVDLISTGELNIAAFAGQFVAFEIRLSSDNAAVDAVLQIDNIAVLAQQLVSVSIGDGEAKSITYTDDDGTSATISLRGGTADIFFSGSGIVPQIVKKVLVIDATATDVRVEKIAVMVDSDTRMTSRRLTIKTKKSRTPGDDGMVEVGSMDADGGIGTIYARKVQFREAMLTISGALKSIRAYSFDDSQLVVQQLAGDTTTAMIQFTEGRNFDIDTEGSADVRADVWVNDQSDVKGLHAAWAKGVSIKTRSAIAMFLSGQGAPKQIALKTARLGDFEGGTWVIGAATGTVSANHIDGMNATFTDAKSIKLKLDLMNSQLSGTTLMILAAKNDIANTVITLDQPFDPNNPKKVALKTLKAGNSIRDLTLRSSNSLGNISADTIFDSDIFVAVADTVNDLPQSDADFVGLGADPLPSIRSFRTKGNRNLLAWINNTNVAAPVLGKIHVGFAGDNGGGAYGFAARRFDRGIRYRNADTRLNLPSDISDQPGQTPVDQNLVIQVV